MSYAKIRPRRGTINDWTLANPVLEQGEIAVEYPLTGVGSGLVKIKIGDGINTYTNLPYPYRDHKHSRNNLIDLSPSGRR